MRKDIEDFVAVHNQRVEPLYIEYAERFWEMSSEGGAEASEALVEAKSRYLDVFGNRDDYARLEKLRAAATDVDLDPVTARQLEHIHHGFVPYQMEPSALAELVRRETEIEAAFNTFRADLDGSKVTDNALRELLRDAEEADLRRRAWEASKQVGRRVADDLIALVELRNREAKRLGYSDFYELMLEVQELDSEWLSGLLDDLEAASEAAYVEMKDDLDARLRQRFGIDPPSSPPWLYADPFFQELPGTDISNRLDSIFRNADIPGLTRRHFDSLGLDVGDLLRRADLYEREGKSQHAFCMDMDRRGDVRVLCNLRPNERWMSTMLHEFGHAVYDKYNDRALPFALREPAHTFTTEAIAMLNGRMTKTPSWLVRFAGVDPDTASGLGREIFQGIRSSMLIFLRWALTLVRFERELYRDPGQPLGQLWWELVGRIQKVTPPGGRAGEPDWASKIHLATNPVYYQNYILGELMASQIMDHLRVKVVGEELFSPATGDYLKLHIFEPGARWRWDELLRRATGESLNPAFFLGQFEIA